MDTISRQFLLAVAALSCGCNMDQSDPFFSGPRVVINSPVASFSVAYGETIQFHVTATTEGGDNGLSEPQLGLQSVELQATTGSGAATTRLALCLPTGAGWGTAANPATCEVSLPITPSFNFVSEGSIVLTAVATANDRNKLRGSATVALDASPLACTFAGPPLTTAPDAAVTGTSEISIQTLPALAQISSVVVHADDGQTPLTWPGNAAEPSPGLYSASVDWKTLVGLGHHTLIATCTAADGRDFTTSRQVDVLPFLRDPPHE